MYKIGTFNKISPVGLGKLTDDYAVVENQGDAHGIILRSYDLHDMDFSENWASWYSTLRAQTPTL